MDAHETDGPAERPHRQPVVVTSGISFEVGTDVTGAQEVGADVTGTRVHVEVQWPERRVQVVFGSFYGSFLMLWLSDPDEIAEITGKLADAGEELARALASGGPGDA